MAKELRTETLGNGDPSITFVEGHVSREAFETAFSQEWSTSLLRKKILHYEYALKVLNGGWHFPGIKKALPHHVPVTCFYWGRSPIDRSKIRYEP